jgi:hypothetical protein
MRGLAETVLGDPWRSRVSSLAGRSGTRHEVVRDLSEGSLGEPAEGLREGLAHVRRGACERLPTRRSGPLGAVVVEGFGGPCGLLGGWREGSSRRFWETLGGVVRELVETVLRGPLGGAWRSPPRGSARVVAHPPPRGVGGRVEPWSGTPLKGSWRRRRGPPPESPRASGWGRHGGLRWPSPGRPLKSSSRVTAGTFEGCEERE